MKRRASRDVSEVTPSDVLARIQNNFENERTVLRIQMKVGAITKRPFRDPLRDTANEDVT